MRKKGKLTREFDTGEILVVRKKVKSRKRIVYHILVFKTK